METQVCDTYNYILLLFQIKTFIAFLLEKYMIPMGILKIEI